MNTSYWNFFSILSLVLISFSINSQVFWTETFGEGCNQGTEINGYSTDNGIWSIQETGVNGQNANVWYVSATASFSGVGNCSESCLTDASANNMSLHIGKSNEDSGAIYASSGDVQTAIRAESPVIDASNYCAIELDFDFILGGDEESTVVLWYYNGEIWSELGDLNPTGVCADGAEWESFSINLPPSSHYNAAIQLAFEWKNEGEGAGDRVSFAVDNITLTAKDEENPFLSCPSQLVAYIGASGCAAEVPDFSASPAFVITDDCSAFEDLSFSQSPTQGTAIAGHETSVNVFFIVADEAGNSNSCQVEVVALDTLGPVIDCPSLMTEYADQNCSALLPDFTSEITVSDNCSAINAIQFQQFPAPNFVVQGEQEVTLTAQDENGNLSTCVFMFVLEDTIRPNVTCPVSNLTQPAQETSCDGILNDFTTELIWSDNCTSDVSQMTFLQSPAAGTTVNGSFSVELIAVDAAGNENSCSVNVTVVDVSGPVLTCPTDTVMAVNNDCQYTVPELLPVVSAIDNCSAIYDITFQQSPPVGVPADWNSPVLITATDELGNTSTCEIAIIPDGIDAPTITCPSNMTVDNGVSCEFDIVDYTNEAVVNFDCGGITVSQFPEAGEVVGPGEHEIILIADYGGQGEVNCSFTLTVIETEAPSITCPTNISSCVSLVTYDAPEFSDNCDGASLLQVDGTGYTSGDDFPIGITNQTYVVTDASGNTANCTFTVEVIDVPEGAKIVTPTTSLCDTTSLVVEAEEVASGSGEWKVISGSGTFNNQFAYVTGVNNLSLGENVIVWEVNLPQCDDFVSSDTLRVTVYKLPFPASTQSILYNCGHEQYQLSANTPNVGNGLWYAVDSNPSFNDSTIPNALVSGLNVGWNELVWQISNGSCPVSRDTLNLFYKPNAKIFNQDTTICVSENELFLVGNEVADPMSNVWAFATGNGIFESQTATETMASSLAGGLNTITLSQNHPFCGMSRDTLKVLVELCEVYEPNIPTVFTPNNDGKNDLFIIEDLAVLYPDCEVQIVNRWGNIVYESTGYLEPWNGTLRNEGEQLPLGTYFYRIDLNDGSRDVITGSISIVR